MIIFQQQQKYLKDTHFALAGLVQWLEGWAQTEG